MKVLFFLRYFRDQASSRVRGFDMAEELKRRGVDCSIIYGSGRGIYPNFLLKLLGHDIIYFQKKYLRKDIRMNRIARMMGKRTIFDLDDAPSGVALNPEAEEKAIQMMKNSSAVVVGCQKLMYFAKNYNDSVYHIPSPVSLNYYRPKEKKEDHDYVTVGWAGNGIGYKKDLMMLVRPLEKSGEKHDIKLLLVGARGQKEIYENFGRLKNVKVEIIDWVSSVDPYAIPEILSRFDIGLYPLLDNKYNQYKCSLKGLEYMAMKVPVIASPVGENKVVIESGRDGFLPSNEKEWEESIQYLVENQDARERMGEMGRKKIERHYSTEVCAKGLIEVFKEIREGGPPRGWDR